MSAQRKRLSRARRRARHYQVEAGRAARDRKGGEDANIERPSGELRWRQGDVEIAPHWRERLIAAASIAAIAREAIKGIVWILFGAPATAEGMRLDARDIPKSKRVRPSRSKNQQGRQYQPPEREAALPCDNAIG